MVEQPFGLSLQGAEMQPTTLSIATQSHDVAQLATGAWQLATLQRAGHYISERDTSGGVIRATEAQFILGVVEAPRFRQQSELTDVTYDASVAAQGNYFLSRSVAASGSWDPTIAGTLGGDTASYGQPTLPTANVPMSRWMVGTTTDPDDQGYVWVWTAPGAPLTNSDIVNTVYFGGPATIYGDGQYCVVLAGGGMAALYERVTVAGGGQDWMFRAEWEYSQAHRSASYTHKLWIHPYSAPQGGGYIEFQSTSVESLTSRGPGLTDRYTRAQALNATFVYRVLPKPGRLAVTGAGVPRMDGRNDLRFAWQVSRLLYADTGLLTLAPFTLGFFHSVRTPLTLRWSAIVPDGCTLTGRLHDAVTGVELTELSRTTTGASYTPTPQQPCYYAAFEFEGEGSNRATPTLWGCEIVKDGVTVWNTPGEFDVVYQPETGKIPRAYPREISITGPELDITHETATAVVEDKAADLWRLRVRGTLAAQIETEYDPTNTSLRSVLFAGDCLRPAGTRKGRRGATFPSSEWRQFECGMVGMWRRLRERPPLLRLSFAQDPTQPAGVPYKVTDIIRYALTWAGFLPEQIDVPDLSLRLWPALGDTEALMMDPLADLWELVYKLTKDYLGWHIVWCGNSGSYGMWRLLPPATSPYINLAEFVTTGGTVGALQSHPGAYGTARTFIKTRTIRSYPVPPEANFVFVTGTGELTPGQQGGMQVPNWDANPDSYNFLTDGSGTLIETADPDHPDYIGRFVPLVIVNPALQSYEAVTFAVRRYYDIGCRTTKILPFVAPLLLIWDPTDVYQVAPRPLRYYDPVLVDGEQWLVRSCNPSYRRDSAQWATYELEAPRS